MLANNAQRNQYQVAALDARAATTRCARVRNVLGQHRVNRQTPALYRAASIVHRWQRNKAKKKNDEQRGDW
jgi:hypothetical protein